MPALLLQCAPSLRLIIIAKSYWREMNMNICINGMYVLYLYNTFLFFTTPDCNKPESQIAVEIGLHRLPLVWPFVTGKEVLVSFDRNGVMLGNLHRVHGSNKVLHGYKIWRFQCALYEWCVRTNVQELWRRGRQIAYRACTVDRLFEFLVCIDPCNSIDALSYDRYRQLQYLDRPPNCQDQG